MVSGNYQELVKQINDLLHVRFGERMRGTILFGSEAQGNSSPESDLDVMVLLNGPVNTGDDLEQIIKATDDIQLISDRSIHYIPADYDEYIKANMHCSGLLKRKEFFMSKGILDLWDHACKSFNAVSTILDIDPDSAASRAYYAAFQAVSAKFLLEGKIFSKHNALESAVHKKLIKPGKWPMEIGQDFSWISGLRSTGYYGGVLHVNKNDAIKVIVKAKNILTLIESENPSIKE